MFQDFLDVGSLVYCDLVKVLISVDLDPHDDPQIFPLVCDLPLVSYFFLIFQHLTLCAEHCKVIHPGAEQIIHTMGGLADVDAVVCIKLVVLKEFQVRV